MDFHGEKRSNQTLNHDEPGAKDGAKVQPHTANLSFAGHALMENKSGLLVDVVVAVAKGWQKREAALAVLAKMPGEHSISVGADK